jgi:hypothetical protein
MNDFRRPRPFGGFGRRPFFGAPFLGGVVGGLLGSAIIASTAPYPYPYPYYPPYPYPYYTYPPYIV